MSPRIRSPRPPLHRVHAYARDVLNGTIVAGPLVRLACKRHDDDRRTEQEKGFYFDDRAADHAIDFIETWVRLPDVIDQDGVAKPFHLEPWQVFIVGSLFGWRWTSGFRRYRNAFVEVGKGNGKTPLLAAIGLYGLLMDGQKAPEVYAAAADRDQAMIMFRDAVRMVDASPDIAPRIKKTGINHITNLGYGLGFFRPFSREQGSKSGTRPHMGLIDEIHEHPNAEIINKMRAGAKGNMDAMFLEITNSGTDRTSICWQHHEHSRKILEHVLVDDRWFAYVCTLDDGDDPLVDPTCWIKTNPNLGVSIHAQPYLTDQVSAARNIPSETNIVLRLNFCVWTQSVTRFFPSGVWVTRTGPTPDDLSTATCYAGMDLGQSDDFTAFVLVWVFPDGRLFVRPTFWIPSAALAKPNRLYDQWTGSGALTIVADTDVVDYGQIQDAVYQLCRAHGVREVAYDKRFAEQMAQNLTALGITMIDTPQGFQLTEALRKLSDAVVAGTLSHDGNAVLSWMSDNFQVKHGPNGQLRPDKEKAADKIDGPVALTMALSSIVRQQQVPTLTANDIVVGVY